LRDLVGGDGGILVDERFECCIGRIAVGADLPGKGKSGIPPVSRWFPLRSGERRLRVATLYLDDCELLMKIGRSRLQLDGAMHRRFGFIEPVNSRKIGRKPGAPARS
jgi:hypothetical protein